MVENKIVGWSCWLQWTLATGLGWTITGVAIASGSISSTCLVAVVGVLQWFVLLHYISKAGWWILASIAGVVLAGIIFILLFMEGLIGVTGEPSWFTGAVAGAMAGAMQWLVLRQHVSQAAWWIVVSVIAVSVGRVIGFATGPILGILFGSILTGLVIGAITGLLLMSLLQHPLPATNFDSVVAS